VIWILEGGNLECQTAKYKLDEAKFFLEKLRGVENEPNEFVYGVYLNAFIYSANSVTDYVHADFIYNTINNPRIDWKDYQGREMKKEILEKHPDKIAIEKFRSKYFNELNKFLRDPIANYFRFKRNKITHVRWDATKSGKFVRKDGGDEIVTSRNLESSIMYAMAKDGKVSDLDLFDDKVIPWEEQLDAFRRLCSEDINSILDEFIVMLEKFIQKFDGQEFF